MFYKICAVSPLDEYTLLVEFQNAQKKIYDVRPLFAKWPAFEALRQTHGLFQQVKVDTGGYGVVWNDAIDLSCNELYEQGQLVDDPRSIGLLGKHLERIHK